MESNAYRQAALIVSSLDRTSADEVLERLPQAQAQAIRDQMMLLDNLALSERDRAIDDFLQLNVNEEEISPTFQARANSPSWPEHPVALKSTTLCSFHELLQLDGSEIATAIVHERTSIVAALLSAMPDKRAAEVMRRLPVAVQSRAAAALNLGIATKSFVLNAVADKICDKQAESSVAAQLSLQHRDALQAIFNELNQEERAAMLRDLEQEHPLLAQRLNSRESLKSNDCYC